MPVAYPMKYMTLNCGGGIVVKLTGPTELAGRKIIRRLKPLVPFGTCGFLFFPLSYPGTTPHRV